jgi:3-oxoacyl-[acyl-carrier-protein] synthase III
MTAGILGVGYYVPDKIVTNFDLENQLETTDEWIRTRTGIRERRIASGEEATSDLALKASVAALSDAGVAASELDLIVLATCTPDLQFPATAAIIQAALKAPNAAAFDLNAVCAGFSYALDVAAQMVGSGAYNRALVIGADIMSRTVDWKDRSTCVLFGDGAGAVVLGSVENGGVLGSILGADGAGANLLCMSGGGSRRLGPESAAGPGAATMYMNGKEVYKFAVQIMGEAALKAVRKVGLEASDIDLLIPHQANIRIIESAAKRLDLPMSRVFVNLDRYGNTSAASIPIAIAEAVEQNIIVPGMIVVTVGFGAGLTWGANVIRWTAR